MNINNLNKIKTLNIDSEVAGMEKGTGTYQEILDMVMKDKLIPLVHDDGEIYGFYLVPEAESHIGAEVEKMAFSEKYDGKPLMEWFSKALKAKAGIEVDDDDGDDEDDWDGEEEYDDDDEEDCDEEEILSDLKKLFKKLLDED